MREKYVVAVDLGTTVTKTVIFDYNGSVKGLGEVNSPIRYSGPGRTELTAETLMDAVFMSNRLAIKNAGIEKDSISGISFTHICSTFVPLDKNGSSLFPIIAYNDMRGEGMFDYVKKCWEENGVSELDDYKITGYPLGGITTLCKVLWLKKNHPEIYDKTKYIAGMQALLTYGYTGEAIYDDVPGITYSKLARVSNFKFDASLANMYGLDIEKYAERKNPGYMAGVVSRIAAEKSGLKQGTPVYVGSGDQRCAAIGAGLDGTEMFSMCLGTSGVLHAYSPKPVFHKYGNISVLGHAGTGHWQVEGSFNTAGSSLKWFADTFCQQETACANVTGRSRYELIEECAQKSKQGAGGVIFTPWLTGTECPKYNANATASITGLTAYHQKSDTARAVLEGVCFEMRAIMNSAEETVGYSPNTVRVVGGCSKSKLWNKIQAEIYNKRVETLKCDESTALGAAMFVCIGENYYRDIHEAISNMVHVNKSYYPEKNSAEIYDSAFSIYNEIYEGLKRAYLLQKEFRDKYYV